MDTLALIVALLALTGVVLVGYALRVLRIKLPYLVRRSVVRALRELQSTPPAR